MTLSLRINKSSHFMAQRHGNSTRYIAHAPKASLVFNCKVSFEILCQKGIVFYDNYIDDDYLYKLYMLATNANVAFRHACLIFDKRGNVVASGYNYSPQYSGYSHTIHAEDAAIRDLKNKGLYEKAHKYTLFVVRIGGCTLIDEYGNPKSSSEKK